MKALIVYHSKKGNTKKYAEKIGRYIATFKGSATIKSISEVSSQDINAHNLIFLGCWTSGKFIFGQKPDKEWTAFTDNLPELAGKDTVLFTTYKILTGSMFRNMKKQVEPKGYKILGCMKSRNGKMDYYSFVALKYALSHHIETSDNIFQPLKEQVLEAVPVL